jgi:sigma-B regulation protein RsbU (phosphoserine phosphatase)
MSIENGDVQLLDLGTTVLGMFSPLPFNNKGRFENITQFTLLCYTDGLTESENDNGEEFGPEILEELLDACIELSPNEINLKMLQSVDDFRKLNPYKDDVTLLTCKIDYTS